MRWLTVTLCLIGLYEPIPQPIVRLEKLEQEGQALTARWYLEDFPNNEDWTINYEAEVWNSSLPGHCSYRHAEGELLKNDYSEVVVGEQENGHRRCRELIHVWLAWPRLGCQITHLHNKLTAPPLFGARVITLGNSQIKLHADFTYSPIKKVLLSHIPEERLDNRRYFSPPDSLYLNSNVPGYQYFRFRDAVVDDYGEASLKFNYLALEGKQGTLRVRLTQYHDTPQNWQRLENVFDMLLPKKEKWSGVQEIIKMHPEATTLALDFRLVGDTISEAWIDDIEILRINNDLIPGPDYRQWYKPFKD